MRKTQSISISDKISWDLNNIVYSSRQGFGEINKINVCPIHYTCYDHIWWSLEPRHCVGSIYEGEMNEDFKNTLGVRNCESYSDAWGVAERKPDKSLPYFE